MASAKTASSGNKCSMGVEMPYALAVNHTNIKAQAMTQYTENLQVEISSRGPGRRIHGWLPVDGATYTH